MSAISKEFSQIDPSSQLLLLLSRLELTIEQEKAVLALCSRIDDWAKLTDQARQRFVLPLVYRHLWQLAPENISPNEFEDMKYQCLTVAQHYLLVASTQRKLVKELTEPLGILPIFFKGHSLAARYYDEPAMRFSRDIDVLVPHERMVELLEAALKKGYIPCDPKQLETDRTSLEFLARVQGVITLMTPQGVVVEFHQRIDYTGTVYKTEELLSTAEFIVFEDIEIPVMPTAELFVYICLHHTKHHWSHLHWLVDLDAVKRHPSFDLNDVYACAEKRNLTETVKASLELYEALASPNPGSQPMSAQGRQLLEACLTALQGDYAVEQALSRSRATPDFSFAWQANRWHWLRWKFFGWVRIFRPSYTDYRNWPLPNRWQWVYRPVRPFREAIRRLGLSKA
ncbi:nucleotidyltransferase family protein [Halomonas campisalis]|uniref:Nucleotidyltransferase family protein n=1 Tax=Billgrantia campisalis TaxID=74661 RepID=A0ABS9P3G3_9GAMM|nr:nucleotidyltransferase family protein [Halomonas campisalis]MCG6656327.1 nucleotidyltransferase family protein [Halomonas campisalis]MDR5861513.1 nucleotidyltransferase family protein [Halomonas campisalis]